MKKLNILSLVFCTCVLVAQFSDADNRPDSARDGVKVSVQYDPQGPNNLIVARITFINENPYRVDVSWRPIINCESGNKQEGVVAGFSVNQGENYWVNIARSSACGQGRIRNIDVEMDVKKAGP